MSDTMQRFCRFALVVVVAAMSGACATTGSVPATMQPALGKLAEPYADGLRKAGVSSVMVYGNGARVRVGTVMGDVFFRYPAGLASTDFAVYVGRSVEVDSDAYSAANSAQYEAALKTILPEAIKWAAENNTVKTQEGFGGGGGGRGGGR